jgi:hypothetical protein
MEKYYEYYYKNKTKVKKTFSNIFTENEFKIFNKIGGKRIIYNNDLHFFNCLSIVNKVIQSGISIYSDNLRIRQYLFENGGKPKFIKKKYINVKVDTDLSIFKRFKISSDENVPLVIKLDGNIELIIERLMKKLPTIIVNKINILEIENAVCKNRLLYIENVDEFIKKITNNLYVSEALLHFSKRLKKKYCKKKYDDGICLFFGMYSLNDIYKLKIHNGYKFLLWGGTDCNWNYKDRVRNFDYINKIPDLYHIAISKDIQERLRLKNIESVFFDMNLVDKKIFKPILIKGESIFIYNGYTKGNEYIYGEKIYKEVVKKLPEFNFIYSNVLNLPYEKMPEIYAKCFIGLRLTDHDGNANMVQEMMAMNIPVVHNLSDYGLKWKNLDNIIEYINKYKI